MIIGVGDVHCPAIVVIHDAKQIGRRVELCLRQLTVPVSLLAIASKKCQLATLHIEESYPVMTTVAHKNLIVVQHADALGLQQSSLTDRRNCAIGHVEQLERRVHSLRHDDGTLVVRQLSHTVDTVELALGEWSVRVARLLRNATQIGDHER